MLPDAIQLFALDASQPFAERVASALGIALAAHEERTFEDGEHKTRSLESVRNRDVFVLQSIYGDQDESVNDKLCRLLFFIGGLRDAGADSVTALVPYLCYARKDRKTKSRDPVTTRYVAELFECVGTDRVVTMDVHNLAAFQNAFRCRTDHLEAVTLFVDHFAEVLADDDVAVVSPDVGGVKRAERLREALTGRLEREVGSAFMEKQRSRGVVSGNVLVGDVANRSVILIDDMIVAGTTMARAARACTADGANRVFAAATHGLFVAPAEKNLLDGAFDQVVVTDAVPPFRLTERFIAEKLTVLDASILFADAVRRIHSGALSIELTEAGSDTSLTTPILTR